MRLLSECPLCELIALIIESTGRPLSEWAFSFFQNKSKELAFLCFLKGLELDPLKLDEAVNNLR